MDISVIIPTYNRAHFLGFAVQSALDQTYCAHDILIVDDGSTEDVVNALKPFGERTRYVRQENAGKSAAVNLGLELVKGDAVVILDDDDLLPPWTLEEHVRALQSNPSADFSYGAFARFDHSDADGSVHLTETEHVPVNDPRRLVVKLMENCFLPNPCWAIRREAWTRVGPYRPAMRYSQDYDMILRMARNNEGAFVEKLVLYQRKHVGARGPEAERVVARDTQAQWIAYDRELFERLDRDWSLEDFRPFAEPISTPQQEAVAWLQKGVVMFLRKAYGPALHAIGQYLASDFARTAGATELKIASGLLGCRYGIDDLLQDDSVSLKLRGLLNSTACTPSLRAAFARSLRWRLKKAGMAKDWREAKSIAQLALRTFTPMLPNHIRAVPRTR